MKKIALLMVALCAFLAIFTGCGSLPLPDFGGNEQDLTFPPVHNHTRQDILLDENGESQYIYSDYSNQSSQSGTSAEVSGTPETSENPPVGRETRLRFLAAGDNIIHGTMIEDAKERANDGGYNFRDMYKHIENDIMAADIAFINVETPIAGDEFEYTGYPNFNTPKENGIALVDIGFDIINTANNHMLDKKEKGYINSIDFWENQEAFMIGSHKNEDDFESVRIYNKNGISIAFLSYTYGTNGMFLPSESEMIIPWLDAAVIERQVKAARPHADLLFVVLHWGEEDSFTPNAEQRDIAQMLVDNGVDVIIGMHPHVIQETKWVDRPDGGRTLTAYSLGNFISSMLYGKNMIGAMLGFDIVKTDDGNGESRVWIENAEMIPVMTHFDMNRRGLQVYKFEDYTKELAELHGCNVSDSEFSYEYIKNLITENIQPQFLGSFYADQ